MDSERKMMLKLTLLVAWSLTFELTLGVEATDYSCNPNTFKVDCHPDPGANETGCLSRGCCWLDSDDGDIKQAPYVKAPSCFFPSEFNCYHIRPIKPLEEEEQQPTLDQPQHEDYPLYDRNGRVEGGYEEEDEEVARKGDSVVKGKTGGQPTTTKTKTTKAKAPANSIRWLLIRKLNCFKSGFADDAEVLELSVSVHGDSIINIKISDPDRRRFEPSLPEIKLPAPLQQLSMPSTLYIRDSKRIDVPVGNYHLNDDGDHDDDAVLGEKLKIGPLVVRVESKLSSAPYSHKQARSSVSVLKVIHQPSGAILFESDLGKLIYSRQLIQLPTYLASSLVYGLGQHMGESLLKSSDGEWAKSYTMFNYGHPPLPDGRTAYSTYPFYINLAQLLPQKGSPQPLLKDVSKESFEMLNSRMMATGALMLNSNAMDVLLHSRLNNSKASNGNGRAGITWRLVGGIVDLYLFVGPKPHDVIGQYQSLVGRPQLPPAWSLGYHQSRLNYRDLLQIKLAWARTRSAGIPMESIWTDLEFMWRTTSYTLNNNELGELVRIMKQEFDMHYVPIVDPAISLSENPANYEALKMAESMDLFAISSSSPRPSSAIGRGGNGSSEANVAVVTTWTDSKQSGILDFTHPMAINYLRLVLEDYWGKLNFDGLWLDMNEPEVFANEPMNEAGEVCVHDERLQYLPGGRPLNDRTLCMAAEFWAGKHYDLHNLYAFYQSKAHFEALQRLSNSTTRPFIISRSQFVGQGKYSGSWLGDLGSTFKHLSWSLLGTIESNWFGQPLIGADICGFFGSTTDELCARWFSLGAFYPLSRNHNEGSAHDQDPGSLGEPVQRAARIAMLRRYSLLPYLYSLFYENHLEGKPVVRSVLFQFFEQFYLNSDLDDLPQIDDQLMWGPALMIAPILEADSKFRTVYLPKGRWYDVSIGLPGSNMDNFYHHDDPNEVGHYDALISNWPHLVYDESRYGSLNESARTRLAGLRKSIDCYDRLGCKLEDRYTPVGAINLYLRGGHIVPTFRNVNHTNSVNQLWSKASFFLEIAPDLNEAASGTLFWDSGESDPEARLYNRANFSLLRNKLVITVIESQFEDPLRFDGFVVYGFKLGRGSRIPEPELYRNCKLLYTYDVNTETLRCRFMSPDMERPKPLTMVMFDSLVITW